MPSLTGFWGIVECGFCLGALVALGLAAVGLVIALRRKQPWGWALFAVGSVLLLGIATAIGAFVLLLIAGAPR
jgi:hypothetical protein